MEKMQKKLILSYELCQLFCRGNSNKLEQMAAQDQEVSISPTALHTRSSAMTATRSAKPSSTVRLFPCKSAIPALALLYKTRLLATYIDRAGKLLWRPILPNPIARIQEIGIFNP